MFDTDTMGPVDVAVFGFTGPDRTGVANAILDLIDRDLIRIIDLAFVAKDDNGEIDLVQIVDSDLARLIDVLGEQAELLSEEDILEVGDALEPGTAALAVVWENTWVAALATEMRAAGGIVLEHARIPHEAVVEAIEAARAAVEEAQS